MEFNEVLQTRRSVREFKEDKVEKEKIEAMLEAAKQAPSWKNSQTARCYVVMSDEKLKAVREQGLPEFNQKSCANAPVLIVTTFVKTRAGFTREGVAENEVGEGWGCYDLGLNNANMVLKATELGLSTLIMGIRDGEKLREILEIPENQEVVAVIAVGYSDLKPEMPKRKNIEDVAVFC